MVRQIERKTTIPILSNILVSIQTPVMVAQQKPV
jgi:hypothetical protein